MNPRVLSPVLSVVGVLALGATLSAQINPGNLVVVRIGDGAAALTNAAQAVFLDEYTTSGTLVQSIAMPTVVSGSNLPLTNSGTATSEGFLTLSANGQYLVSGGYGTSPGTASVASTTSAAVNRVIARVGLNGVVDTSTALTDTFSANNIRSATTDDGTRFWAAGANGGIRFTTLGATTSTALNTTAPTNNRVVDIYAGQLYTSSATGAFQGLSAVGSGLPTGTGNTITLLPGFPTASGPSAYDFFFADAATVYVADDRASVAGGIQKWTLDPVSGTWSLAYTLNPPQVGGLNVGCRGLTGTVRGGIATLYATTTSTTMNQIVSVTDTGAAAQFTVVATTGTNTVLRGIRLVPAGGGSLVRIPHGCGQATISVTGSPTLGGSVSTTLGGTVGVTFIGMGFVVANTPFCVCTIGHDWSAQFFTTAQTLNIPNNPIWLGVTVGIQGVDLFGLGGCQAPQFSATDTVVMTIG